MRAIDKMKKSPKSFFSFARSKYQIKRPKGPLIVDGNAVTDPVETEEVIKTNFKSVYCPPIEEKL